MNDVLVAVRFLDNPPPIPPEGSNEVRPTVWQSVADPTDYQSLRAFPDESAADDHLRLVAGRAPSPNRPIAAEAHHVAIEHRAGRVLGDVPIGGYLVAARSLANPGYGPEARDRLEEVVESIALLPSYAGHIVGANATLDEESWAFVFGNEPHAAPRPDNSEVSAHLYRRIA